MDGALRGAGLTPYNPKSPLLVWLYINMPNFSGNERPAFLQVFKLKIFLHGKTELDAAGFIRAEENDKQTNIKKFVENFTFFVKIRHIIYAIQNRLSCEPAFVYVLHIQCEYMDKLHLLILWKA